MGLTEGLSKLSQQVQDGVRMTAWNVLTWGLKFFSSLVLGFTTGIVVQEVLQSGILALLFVLIVVTGVLLRIMQTWTIVNVVVFDLICVLVGLSLKMYILLAP